MEKVFIEIASEIVFPPGIVQKEHAFIFCFAFVFGTWGNYAFVILEKQWNFIRHFPETPYLLFFLKYYLQSPVLLCQEVPSFNKWKSFVSLGYFVDIMALKKEETVRGRQSEKQQLEDHMTNNVKLGTLICQLEQLSFFLFFFFQCLQVNTWPQTLLWFMMGESAEKVTFSRFKLYSDSVP